MIEQILTAVALGPLDAFRGGQLKRLSHRLPSKIPTVLYGMAIAYMLGLSPLELPFWILTLLTIPAESTGWTIVMEAAHGSNSQAMIDYSLKKYSWWEMLLGIDFIIKHPFKSLFVRSLIWGTWYLPAMYFTGSAIIPAIAFFLAIPLAAFIASNQKLELKIFWKKQELYRGWIAGAIMVAILGAAQ